MPVKRLKWIAPLMAYAAIWAGIFLLHSAWTAMLAFHVVIIGSLLLAKPDIPPSLLLISKHRKWIAVNVLLGGSSGLILYFSRDLLGVAKDLPIQLEAMGLNNSSLLLFIGYLALVNPWIEEYFWRGYLGSPSRGLHFNDLGYAGYHVLVLAGRVQFASMLFVFALLTFAGWFWRQVMRKEGGLLAPVLGHMSADLSVMTAVYWICSS